MRNAEAVLQPFIADVKTIISEESMMERTLERIKSRMESLCREPDVAWPEHHGLSVAHYVDPQDLFSIAYGWDAAGRRIPPHDHGELGWAVYGLVQGTRVENTLFQRLDDGREPTKADLREVEKLEQRPGEAFVVPVGGIHTTYNAGPDASYAVVIRSRDLYSIWRNGFDPEKGTVKRIFGFPKAKG